MKRNEQGYTLIEVLAVTVIIGILAVFAVIGYQAVLRGTRNSIQTVRLMKIADAQGKFRTVMGKRRYGTLQELVNERLLPDETIDDTNASRTASRNGWYIQAGDESGGYLRSAFEIELRNEEAGSFWRYCLAEDGVLRRGTSENASCTRNSPPYNP